MKIKMIVTDLDGTLLRTEKIISDYTKNILTQCRKSGIKTTYATARGGSANEIAPAELFDGRIVMNGALALNGDMIVYRRLIPYQTICPLLVACDKRGMKVISEISGMHYSNFIVSDEWSDIANFKVSDFSKHELDAEKLYYHIQQSDDVVFIRENLPGDLYLTISRDGLAMVMHKEAVKSKAVSALAEQWGIKQSEIVAFGDDLNDIDLLQHCGVSVAVENAIDEAKAFADYICDTNDNDGVAKWLEENLL